ncbi:diguanylate cyclase domain-containing protein [Niveibacterium terrae]|uniref:diguanylate cyclase domain-containing protein n=1 Tax=Niveibacterium terrae TaxID=3373598 RepID=UPI003A93E6F2
MIPPLDIRCASADTAGLHEEIRRRDRIIAALIRQIETGINTESNFGLLQSTLALERLVQLRTEALHQSMEEMEAFIAHAPLGIVFTRDHVILRYNRQFAKMFGFHGDEAVGQNTRTLFRSDDEFEAAIALVDPSLSTEKSYRLDSYFRHSNGTDLWVHSIGHALARKETGASALWMMEDRTSIRRAEDALSQSHQELLERTLELSRREQELRTVIDNAYDAYVSLDENGTVLSRNKRAEEIFGWTTFEAMGRPLSELIIPPEAVGGFLAGLNSLAGEDKCPELLARRRDGSTLTAEIRISLLDFGEHRVFSAFLTDISARKAQERLREHEARHDALTGLPNRRELMDQLNRAIARSQRSGNALGVIFLDLDGFKSVNDSHGHETGDALLVRVAQRLTEEIRETDTVARLAGDEFVIVQEAANPRLDDAAQTASRLIARVSRPIPIGDISVQVGCSIGMLIFRSGCHQNAEELIQQADQAMYRAKRAGKGRSVIIELNPDPPEGEAGSIGPLA